MSNYRDYLSTKEGYRFSDYCLSLISDSTPNGVLTDLKAHVERLHERGLDDALFEAYDLGEAHGVNGVDLQLVAVADIGNGWTLMVQMPGFIGISGDTMAEVIARHDVISHQAGESGGRFEWWSSGQRRTSFEPLMPYSDVLGVLADRQPAEHLQYVIGLMREVGGFDLEYEPNLKEFFHVPASFALAERITGVKVTPDLLANATFTVAVVPLDAASDHDPGLPEPPERVFSSPPTWTQIHALYQASKKVTIHATMLKSSDYPQLSDGSIEFWRKHGRAWRTADADGVCAIEGRRCELWFRENGVLTDQWENAFQLPTHGRFLVHADEMWHSDFADAAESTATGTAVVIANRTAWEFALSDGETRSRMAFDDETGVPLRWIRGGGSYELTQAEIGIPLADNLFEGPRTLDPA